MMIRTTIVSMVTIATFAHMSLAETAPKVVASLKPVHSLVAGVMGEASPPPELLVPGTASPHLYQMRPSEAKLLQDAEIVFWIGENLETFLTRPLSTLGSSAVVITLHEVPRMRLLENRMGGIWHEDENEDEHHVDEHDDHGHDHDEFDMHIWLDPGNARRIVEVVAEELSRVSPDNSETWRRNADDMISRINDKEAELLEKLASVQDRPFVVFHDAYRYFEIAYGLNGFGAVAVDPSRPPGAKRLSELREAMEHENIACVFTEPQFEPELVQTIIEGTEVGTAVLDPVGATIESGPDAWFEIMDGLGESFSECLADN